MTHYHIVKLYERFRYLSCSEKREDNEEENFKGLARKHLIILLQDEYLEAQLHKCLHEYSHAATGYGIFGERERGVVVFP
jgi:hypothetical protein